MNLRLLFFVFPLMLQVRASFIDDFRHAVRHVEHGFEKMLSDVVTDMEDTIHCTVAAMEHILIINGILDKLSDYNRKCPDDSEPKSNVSKDVNYVTPQDLHSSLQNVNRTLDDILSRRTTDKDSLSDSLRNETNRLSEVSEMLRRELEKIFSNVRGELDKIDFNQKSTADVVRDEIELLQKVKKDGDTSELDEIRHVVDDAINVLKSNEDTNSKRSNEKIDEIIKELENTEDETVKEFKAREENEFEKVSNEQKSIDSMYTAEKKDARDKNYETKPSTFASLFDSFENNDDKDSINEVVDMMKESQVVNLLFQDDQPGTDLFGNPHLFGF